MISSVPSLLLLLVLLTANVVNAHVLMVYPTPRTDNDYLFSYDGGVCNPSSGCDAFCGDAYDPSSNPVTTLQVGVPITLQWNTNIAHSPFQYRLSLNPTTGDDHFDLADNILTTISNADAADPSNSGTTGSFSTTVTIPESAMDTCSDNSTEPCVLQLWDLYYFVSCANVFLTRGEEAVEEEELPPPTPAPETFPPLPPQSNTTNNTELVVANTTVEVEANNTVVGDMGEGNSTAAEAEDGIVEDESFTIEIEANKDAEQMKGENNIAAEVEADYEADDGSDEQIDEETPFLSSDATTGRASATTTYGLLLLVVLTSDIAMQR